MKNEELQEAIEILDMEAWLDNEGIRYKRQRGARGPQLNVKTCPECGNEKWKVYLNADTGLGNCFVCDSRYNKFSYIKASLGSPSFRDVADHIRRVARDQGWRPPRRTAVAVNLDTELKLPASVELPIEGRNLKYLENRGISGEIAKYFGLRFSLRGTFEYLDLERRKRVQNYANRIIIPVFDLDGNLVSFQGRDVTGKAEKRYLFPPGFASTGSVIYNGHNVVGKRHVVCGEGVFDTAAIRIALDGEVDTRGIGAIGSFGKHLSHGDEESQLAKLMTLRERGLEIVTFMWDGEQKALEAAVDAALAVKSIGLTARVAMLPKGKDPNEISAALVRKAFWEADTLTSLTVAASLKIKARRMYG